MDRATKGRRAIVWRKKYGIRAGCSFVIALFFVLCMRGNAVSQALLPVRNPSPFERLRFDRLTIDDGLSQNTARAILQDHLGLMWIGTDNGLNRYDGYTFSVYAHTADRPGTLSGSTILSLLEDARGRLWVGTDRGLDCLDRASGIFRNVPSGDPEPFGPVQALEQEDEKQIWIGTASRGLYLIDTETGQTTAYRHDPKNPASLASDAVYDLHRAQNGDLWVATDGGVDRLLSGTARFQHFAYRVNQPDSPSSSRARAILEDREGRIWIGTDGGGLNRLNPATGRFTFYLTSPADPNSISDNRVQALYEDSRGMLWVATRMGLNRYDPEKNTFTRFLTQVDDPQSLGGNQVLSLQEDRSGVLWIGTENAGISMYKPGAHRFHQYLGPQVGLPDSNPLVVQSLLEDSAGQLWIGSMQTGLLRFDRKRGVWESYQHLLEDPGSLSSNAVRALAQDPQGDLWVGTLGGGLNRLERTTGQFTHYHHQGNDPGSLGSDSITSLLVGRDGALWIGTLDAGVDRLEPGQKVFQHYRSKPENSFSLSSDRILSLYQGRQGKVWIGTYDKGLNGLDPNTGQIQRFQYDPRSPSNLSHNQVLSLLEDRQGTLWVGTKGGLNRFDPAPQRFKHYRQLDGLPDMLINCLQEDSQGRLWISTVNGISRFDPQTGAFQNYSVDDGLQSREFIEGACSQSRQGELFFGGIKGFNAFFPEEIEDRLPPPPILITAMKKQDQIALRDLVDGEAVSLNYQDDQITFEFAALDFNAPERNQYAYWLEGFDNQWVGAGEQHFASYSKLPGGRYIFHVKAANRDGVWNEVGVSIPVTVVPPIWETAGFRITAVLLVSSLLYGGYRLRVRSIQRRNAALEQKVAELSQQVKEAAIAAERNRMARDLHDSVTQSLYSLVLMVEAGLRTLEAGRLIESREHLARVGQIAQQALQEMRLMVFQLRQPALEKDGLAGALAYRLEAVERRSGMQARLTIPDGFSVAPQIEENLYFIAQEALNNTLKHSQADHVSVQISTVLDCQMANAQLIMEIRDNGCGFLLSDENRRGGYGLVGMRERAERLGGKLFILTVPGQGTTIRVELPMNEVH